MAFVFVVMKTESSRLRSNDDTCWSKENCS